MQRETGAFRTLSLEDATEYDVRVGVARGFTLRPATEWTTVSNVEVINNSTPPDPPVLVSQSGAPGANLTVTFEPDSGVNYHRTRLFQGAAGSDFGSAKAVASTGSTAQQVTMTRAIPAEGARFWLRSENASGVASAPTHVGNYT